MLGATRNPRDFQPITLPVRVAKLFDAKFILSGHLAEKLPIDMGRAAVLTHKNVHIVVTSRSGPHFAPQFFQSAGIDPFTASVLIAKSPCGFRAAYAEKATQIFVVRAPGCAPSDFWTRPFEHFTSALAVGRYRRMCMRHSTCDYRGSRARHRSVHGNRNV